MIPSQAIFPVVEQGGSRFPKLNMDEHQPGQSGPAVKLRQTKDTQKLPKIKAGNRLLILWKRFILF